MATSVYFEIEHDQEISVSLSFEIEAKGCPGDGWEITSAMLRELAVWLDEDQAEEAQAMLIDKTAWLVKFLDQHDGYYESLVAKLNEKFWNDDDGAREYAEMRLAREAGVD